MKRILLSFAVITALLASCNMNVADVEEPRVKADSTAIGFGVYVNRGVSTKAGKTGELTTATLQEADGGFGVFGYYGNGALYNESSKPDFMYNEVVTYAAGSGKWEYHPVKYWPNEFGTAASSEAVDRLSFFAYAPYAEVIPSTGIVTATGEAANTGIIGLSRNIAAGDPMVMYSASLTPGAGVDLCWGVAAADFTSSVDGDNNHVDKGSPFINVIKPKTGDRLQFEFNHALAQLNVQVDADIDVESHATSSLAAGTHIYVRSVTFTGFTLRGSLNLNANTTNGPAWFDLSGSGRLKRDPITIFDGRTDGLEAIAADVNEVPSGLYPAIVQDGTTVGVTNTPVNLFNSTEKEAPILVIPTSGVPVKVTIVYDVETADPSLPGYLSDGVTRGISVENTITKTVQLSGANMALEAGKKYVLGLHLGLTSVKFDATVADWDNTSYTNTDLPINTTGIESVTLSATEATVWRSSSVTKPTVTAVTATDGTDLTNLATITWSSSNPSVATVDETTGEITTVGHGNTNIKATATYNRASGSAVFALHVNEVTAVSVEPATSSIINTNSVHLSATLTINGGSPVNGTVTAWPTVTWSSSYDKISVDPASTDATYSGTAIVASTTATAAANAVAATAATITAAVGTPFAASEVSGTSTLTCEDKTAIASVNLGATETTVWLSEGASTPTVTVMGTDGNPLTTGVTLAWASNNESVATVTDAGVVTLHDTGEAKLTVTATLAPSATTEASSKTADYKVYVNNVTGVTVAPASSNIVKEESLDLTATLQINGGSDINGTIATWPTVSWSSSYDKVSVSATSTAAQSGSDIVATMTASAAADAETNNQATITAAVSTPSASSDVSGTATLTCVDKIAIYHIDLDAPSTTVWLLQDASTPTVTVVGTDGNPLTTGVTLAWTSNNESVATVTTDGAITLQGTGTATLTVTATLAASATTAADTETADFMVYVNAVTGVSLTPTTSNILIGSTLEIKASLTLNNGNAVNGTITSWPTVAWTSDYEKVTVTSPSTAAQVGSDIVAATTATAANDAAANTQATITATVDAAFTASSTSSVTQTCTLTCSNLTGSGNGFTGWD